MAAQQNISRVYFIGIGGIGMSALARYFLSLNVAVSGYDKSPSDNTRKLIDEGARVHFEDNIDQLDRNADLVVYTPAVPQDHRELQWYRDHAFVLKKRSEVLADITYGGYNICIAGTHGKTTMSVLTAFILRHSGFGCNAFLGGISVNYETNFWAAPNNVNVIEADEYDRSFLRLRPDVALISAMDADHLDIYGDVETMQAAFYQFAGLVEEEKGLLITRFGLKVDGSTPNRHIRYSLQNPSADVYAKNIVMQQGGYNFDVQGDGWEIVGIRLNMGGMHNVENTVAAICIAYHLEIDEAKIRAAIADFKGVHRRFEYVIDVQEAKANPNNVVYIDDYAHHPEELNALLRGARSLFNNRWITVIFQPHLFTRTRDFYKDFADALSIANTVILLPVYPAREQPIAGVSSEMIAREIKTNNVMVMDEGDMMSWVQQEYIPSLPHSMDGDVMITAGAGNIDRLVEPLRQVLSK